MCRPVFLGVLLLGVVGCAEKAAMRAAKKAAPAEARVAQDVGKERPARAEQGGVDEAREGELAFAAPPGRGEPGQVKQDRAVSRKIVYTAQSVVLIDDLDKAEKEMLRLLEERGGYVAQMDVEGGPGAPRKGTWTVRVPAARFNAFLDALGKLGEVRRTKLDSSDVTDSYYDATANIKTLQVEEQGLQKLYLAHAPTSKLDDLSNTRKEAGAEFRRRIEQLQGQVQRWDKDVAYSTATVQMSERKDYVPPLVPNFSGRLGSTFQGSVEALVDLGKFLVLAVVALTPWLLVLAVVLGPVLLVLRRRSRRLAREVVLVAEAAPAQPAERIRPAEGRREDISEG